MKNKYSYVTLLLLFAQTYVLAQQVVIKGNAKSYAGDILKWKCYEDQVTFTEKELGKCKVLESGDFEFKFQIPETSLSFIYLNVFKGILYIEPGKEYEIVLPKKVNKLPEDELNPFFEETEFYIRIINAKEGELNQEIKDFNRLYDSYLSKYFQQFKGKLNKSIADSIINAIEKELPNKDNHFFKNYKTYNYASLRLVAYERNKEKLIGKYFHNKPVLYQNPAYMDMFNQLFSNYLSYFSKTRKGKRVPYYLVRLKSLEKIKSAMDSIEVLANDTLQEMIISKSLYDNFYKDDFPRESIIYVMDSLKIDGSTLENRTIAQNIMNKITTLLLDYTAPDFELPDGNNNLNSLSNYRNKFIYLNFINPKSYTCQQELEVLKEMYAKKYEMLEFVSICVCENIDEMNKFTEENGYSWPFLFYNHDKELLKKYNVKVYPTYYLINPESKLAMSPSFPPTEPSFEARYFDILKAWKQEILNRKSKGKNTN
ncbi:MAG: TlpA disulfide reductase family protein [Bacteroidales bacterium]|nr:TlpA disulfide reductase family protein [Bacteroidales bacterium]